MFNVANATPMLATTTGSVAAGYSSAITVGVAAESWISIYGTNLSSVTRALASSDLVNDVMPQSLGGVSVLINNKAAYLQYVSPSQVNVLVPADTATGTVSVLVANASGTSAAASTTLRTY